MKPTYLLLFFALFIFTSCEQNSTEATESNETTMEEPDRLLRHVVLFNFTDSTSREDIQKIEQAFASLPGKIDEIHSFEWGTNNSPEGLDKGLTHCFFVTFRSEEDRDAYLPHPAHQEFVELVGPAVEDVTVVDYWTK
ncbi:MAG TPA: Dabb family protein [Saprospiraceae bacterium]|nr:Dabb family protein [Saprospiraceae bacterium]